MKLFIHKKTIIAGAAAGIFLALCLLPASCHRGPKWNVVILTLDTTRADHLRCYGYDRIETPALNQLAGQGALFENAYSVAPVTLPAHASIMTGLPPLAHGVEDNGAYKVPDEIVTLAEILKERGYQTAGFVSATVLKKEFNLNQGFDHWDEEGITPQKEGTLLVADRKGDKTTDAALSWLKQNDSKPFFLWVHYYDPHAAYEPPEPFFSPYAALPYDGEIAFMDSQIKRVLARLQEAGTYERTLIVAVGDHGEGLGEHQESTHSAFIYNTTQHVPLIIRVPGFPEPGKRIKTVVSQIDLMPTILGYLGVPCPVEVKGEDLREVIAAPADAAIERYAFLEEQTTFLHWGWSNLFGIAGQKWKYIQAPKPELYDLASDPHELRNLIADQTKIAAQLLAKLNELKNKFVAGSKNSQAANVSGQMKEQLAGLGYIVDGFKAREELAAKKDPKDFTDLIPLLIVAQNARSKSDYPTMLKLSDQVLARDPENPMALKYRADALLGLARYEEAIAAYQKYVQIHGENPGLYIQLGITYLRIRNQALSREDKELAELQAREAFQAFEKSLALSKNNELAHYYLGRIALESGDLEKAASHFQDESTVNTEYGHVGMALVYERQGHPALAEAEFQRAGELSGDKSGIYWQEWAIFLIRHDRAKDAVSFLTKALEKDPSLKNEPLVTNALEMAKKAEAPSPEPTPATPTPEQPKPIPDPQPATTTPGR